MKRITAFVAGLALALSSAAATLAPIQLLNPAGSTAGQAIVSSGPSSAPAWSTVTAGSLAPIAANTVLGNFTGSSAAPAAFAVASCSTANSALKYTSGTGLSCGTTFALTSGNLSQFAATTSAQLAGVLSDETGTGVAVFSASPALTGTPTAPTAAAGTSTTQIATTAFTRTEFAAPPAIGNTTPNTGAFTTLSASSTVSGAGFTSLFASPPAIGGTTPAAGAFTTLSASSNAKVIAGNAGGQSIASGGSGTVLTTWAETLDVGSAFNATTGVFTAPVAGQYLVTAAIGLSGPTWAVGNLLQAIVNKNGSATALGSTTIQAAGSGFLVVANVSVVVNLAASDTVSISAFQNGTGSGTTSAALGTAGNYLSIVRIP